MRFSTALIVLVAPLALAAPLPALRRQLAGEGSACNSLFTSTDDGVGYGIKNAEENTAAALSGMHLGGSRRQLHGEGEACDSILSQTDNGVGYGVENAEDNIAANVAGLTGHSVSGGSAESGSTGSNSGPAPAPAPAPAPGPKGKDGPKPAGPGHRRQLDKIANGFGNIGQAAGLDSATSGLVTTLDNVDGTSTSGSADLGASLGHTEETTLEELGDGVLGKRQLDKVANGFGALGSAMGQSKTVDPLVESSDSLDGTLTDGAANLGAGVADSVDSMLEGTGSAVPVIF